MRDRSFCLSVCRWRAIRTGVLDSLVARRVLFAVSGLRRRRAARAPRTS